MAVTVGEGIVYLLGDSKGLDKTVADSRTKMGGWAKSIGTTANTAIKGAIVGGAVAATGAVLGIGNAALSVSSDTRAAANDISASLGVPIEKANEFAGVAREVFRNNFSTDVRQAGDAVGLLAREFEDLDNVSLQGMTESAFAIQDVFGEEYPRVISAAKSLTDEFGITGEQSMDLIASGFQKGLDRSGDFLDSINEYSNQFGDAGAGADQFFNAMESGLKGGMLGTDKAADLFKEFTVRIQDGSESTEEALGKLFGGVQTDEFSDAISKAESNIDKYQNQLDIAKSKQGEWNEKTKESTKLASNAKIADLTKKIDAQKAAIVEATDAQGEWNDEFQGTLNYGGGMDQFLADLKSGTLTQAEAFSTIQEALKGVDDDATRFQLGVALLGTQFEDLGEEAALAMSLTSGVFSDTGGAVDSLNAKYQNFSDIAQGLWRKIAVAMAPVTDRLLEMAINAMPAVEAAIDNLIPKFERFAFDTLIPMIQEIWRAASDAFPAFIRVAGQVGEIIKSIATAIAPVVTAIGNWIKAFFDLSPETQAIIAKVVAFTVAAIAVAPAIISIVTAVGTFITALLSLNPVILAIGAAIAALYVAWQNDFLGIRAVVADLVAYLTPVFNAVMTVLEVLGAVVGSLWMAWRDNFLDIRGATARAIEFILGLLGTFGSALLFAFTNPIEAIKNVAGAFWGFLVETWETGGSNIVGIVQNFVGAITEKFTNWYNALSLLIYTYFPEQYQAWITGTRAIKTIIDGWWTSIKAAWEKDFLYINSITTGAWAVIKLAFSDPLAAIMLAATLFWQGLKALWEANFLGIRESLTAWWQGIKAEWDLTLSNIATQTSTWWTTLKTEWDLTIENIKTSMTAFWNNLKLEWDLTISNISTSMTTFWTNLKTEWDLTTANILTTVTTWWTDISTQFTTTTTAIGTAVFEWLTNLWMDFDSSMRAIYDSVVLYLADTALEFATTTAAIGTAVFEWLTNLWMDFDSSMRAIYDSVVLYLTDMMTEWSTWLFDVAAKVLTWWGVFSSNWSTNYQTLKTLVMDALAAILLDWTTQIAAIGLAVANHIIALKLAFTNGFIAMKLTVTLALLAIKTAFETAFTSLVTTVTTKAAAAVTAIKTAFAIDWLSVGSAVVDGIAGGITAGAWKIAAAARTAANSALASAKAALGIESPSKVMRQEVGLEIPRGVAEGITKGTPEIQAAFKASLSGLTDFSLPSFSDFAPATTNNTTNTPINIEVTINGNADEETVRSGINIGISDALRQAGVFA